MAAIVGQTLNLYDNSTNPPTLLASGVTAANGTVQVSWTPADDHTEQLQAVFVGVPGQYAPSSSPVQNYTVDSLQPTVTGLSNASPQPCVAGSPSNVTISLNT